MSRDFTGSGGGPYMYNAAANVRALNRSFSITALVNFDTVSSFQGIISCGNGGWYLRLSNSGRLQLLESQVAVLGTSSTTLSTGTWYQVGVKLDNASPANGTFYLNGTADGTFSTSATLNDSSTDKLTICADNFAGGVSIAEEMDGRIAELAVYNEDLAAADWASLGAKFCPRLVRPSKLLAYWPVTGRHSPELELGANKYTATIVSTANFADHPRVVYPKRQMKIVPAFTPPAPSSAFSIFESPVISAAA